MGQPVSDIEKHGLVSEPIQSGGHISRSRKRLAPLLLVLCLVLWLRTSTEELAHVISRDSVVAPSNTHLDHCSSIPPIGVVEFRERQKKLAGVLHELGAAAYITEPGPNALYFTNVSQSSWRTSERPFLLIITPEPESHGADAQLTVLTPAFEETRARLLTIPAPHTGLQYTSWQEDGDPYKTALNAVIKASGLDNGVIFVDEAARYFVADKLAKAGSGFEVKIAPPQVRALRERKSVAEIALMTCANEATLLAIRHTRERMYIGITASETSKILTKALGDAGLVGGGGLILFGDDAARPHGGGVDRSLAKDELVLIDVGGSLHGYVSDITRTFALPDSEIPSEHLEIWFIVQEAQNAAAKAARAGAVAGNVDKAARDVITRAGYGQYYTHRTGHGIGLEGHEDPYLRGNNHIRLVEQNAFSDEPGIYIDGKVGVRLEDVFVIDSRSGNALFLTDAVGGRAKDPWNP